MSFLFDASVAAPFSKTACHAGGCGVDDRTSPASQPDVN
jgi:hypothetical protein